MQDRLASLALLAGFLLPSLFFPDVVTAAPIIYQMTGSFDAVNNPPDFGPGPFDSRHFTIGWSVPDPSSTPFSYNVQASLSIDGIGDFIQPVVWHLGQGFDAGLGGFQNILAAGDSLFFGICGGGACKDPILANLNPADPVLFTGTFPLGRDSSCFVSAPCFNAQVNYFSANTGFGTRFVGTLVVADGATPVPEPSTAALLGLGIAGLGYARWRFRNKIDPRRQTSTGLPSR